MRRDERITFQEKNTTGTNDHNEEIYNWIDIATDPTMWAAAMPHTVDEDFQNVQEQGFQRYRFKVLYRDDLDIQMRISWREKFWNIKGINPIHKGPRHKKLEIIAEWRQGEYEN